MTGDPVWLKIVINDIYLYQYDKYQYNLYKKILYRLTFYMVTIIVFRQLLMCLLMQLNVIVNAIKCDWPQQKLIGDI